MVAINNAIENAEHYSTKRQLLAIVAADYPSTVLHAYFPTVTDFQIKAARKHAYLYGEKALILRNNLINTIKTLNVERKKTIAMLVIENSKYNVLTVLHSVFASITKD